MKAWLLICLPIFLCVVDALARWFLQLFSSHHSLGQCAMLLYLCRILQLYLNALAFVFWMPCLQRICLPVYVCVSARCLAGCFPQTRSPKIFPKQVHLRGVFTSLKQNMVRWCQMAVLDSMARMILLCVLCVLYVFTCVCSRYGNGSCLDPTHLRRLTSRCRGIVWFEMLQTLLSEYVKYSMIIIYINLS